MADSDHDDRPTCFVAMPVTTPASYAEKLGDASHFPHVLDHLFTPALTKAGYRVIAPTARGTQLIHAEIIRNLEQTDLVLCDLSSLNANVFFELGIRTSLDRPVALVKDKATERIPFDLNALNTHTYDESIAPWTLPEEVNKLAEHVSNVETGSGSGNAMWRYFGLTQRGQPAEAGGLEAKVDLLLAEITKARPTAPTVTGVTPNVGPSAGGMTVTVSGTGFTGAIGVNFGQVQAPVLSVASDNQLIVTNPAASVGTVDVTVSTPAGTSPTSPADHFTYA